MDSPTRVQAFDPADHEAMLDAHLELASRVSSLEDKADRDDSSIEEVLRELISGSGLQETVGMLDILAREESHFIELHEGDRRVYPYPERNASESEAPDPKGWRGNAWTREQAERDADTEEGNPAPAKAAPSWWTDPAAAPLGLYFFQENGAKPQIATLHRIGLMADGVVVHPARFYGPLPRDEEQGS